MGRCNTGLESTHRSLKPESLSRTLVETQCHLVELGLRIDRQVGSFREVLSQQPICVFVGAALPRALRITQVDVHIGGHRKTFMLGHLQPAIPRQRAPQRCGESTNLPAQCGNGRHALGRKGRPPGLVIGFTRSIPRTPTVARHSRLTVDTARCNLWPYHESTNRKRFLERYLLARPVWVSKSIPQLGCRNILCGTTEMLSALNGNGSGGKCGVGSPPMALYLLASRFTLVRRRTDGRAYS